MRPSGCRGRASWRGRPRPGSWATAPTSGPPTRRLSSSMPRTPMRCPPRAPRRARGRACLAAGRCP
eukprot:8362748-Alexandrium_andersonii.AAC.1